MRKQIISLGCVHPHCYDRLDVFEARGDSAAVSIGVRDVRYVELTGRQVSALSYALARVASTSDDLTEFERDAHSCRARWALRNYFRARHEILRMEGITEHSRKTRLGLIKGKLLRTLETMI